MSPAHRTTYPPRRTVFWCLNFRFPESLLPVDSKRINSKSCVRAPLTDWRKTCSLYLTTESGVLTIVYVINLLQYMHYWIQLIMNLLQFIHNMPPLMWTWSRPMSDKVDSDMGIFNGSFVDHSWICLLDRASGYVDKSFQKNSIHYRLWRLQGVPAHCNYRSIALPRRFAGFARSPVCGEHCFFWCLSLQVIFDGICRTSWAYGHIRSTLHMCVSMPGIVYTNYRCQRQWYKTVIHHLDCPLHPTCCFLKVLTPERTSTCWAERTFTW